tara:strand:+ start:716 stop:865 length:150 start_codon:yes stop_codon:yes gene_type:complete
MNIYDAQDLLCDAIWTDWGVVVDGEFKKKYPTIWAAISEIMEADSEERA